MSNKKNILEGYKGIMEIDLNSIDRKYWKEITRQHYEDIRAYKIEQKQLKPHLRYENTIEKVNQIIKMDQEWQTKRLQQKEAEDFEKCKIYNNSKRNL
jgi:hypothetical protein